MKKLLLILALLSTSASADTLFGPFEVEKILSDRVALIKGANGQAAVGVEGSCYLTQGMKIIVLPNDIIMDFYGELVLVKKSKTCKIWHVKKVEK